MTNLEQQIQVVQDLEQEDHLVVEMDIIHIHHQILAILETWEIYSHHSLVVDLEVKEQIQEEIMDHEKVKI